MDVNAITVLSVMNELLLLKLREKNSRHIDMAFTHTVSKHTEDNTVLFSLRALSCLFRPLEPRD